MKKEVAERLKIPKFGECAGQQRGHLEPGIVRMSNEIVRIINRETDIEQDLKDKLMDAVKKKKDNVMNEMIQQIERERQERMNNLVNKQAFQKKSTRTRENSVKVIGFNPRYTEEDLREIFEKKNKVKRVYIVKDFNTKQNKNIAYIDFDQTIAVKESVEYFNDRAFDDCVLTVTFASDIR